MLATRFVPAVVAIRAVDPLVACPVGYDEWLRSQLDDVDLVVMLHIELTQQMEAHGPPDADDPFWSGEFHEWVVEFERRAQRDPDFAAFLADESRTNPMIGYIVAAGDFDGDVLIAVAEALLDSDSDGAVYDTYRDGAISAVLTAISDWPAIALTLLGSSDVVERLLIWNDRAGGAFGIDGDVVGALFGSALRHPFDDPDRMDEAHAILAELVALAHGARFDRGFPPGIAEGITTGLLGYLPFLIDSLGLDADVFFADDRGRFGDRLGSSAAVVDLFGALLRDDSSRVLLLAAIPALAAYDLDAVNNYVKALIEAAETEQIEEEIHAARTRAEWNAAIDVVSKILGTAFTLGGKKLAVAKEVAKVVEAGARWLVDRIDADDLGMEDVHATAFLLLTFGASVAFLDGRRDTTTRRPRPRPRPRGGATGGRDRATARRGRVARGRRTGDPQPRHADRGDRRRRRLGHAGRSSDHAAGLRGDDRRRSRGLEDAGRAEPGDLESTGEPAEPVGRGQGQRLRRQRGEPHRLTGRPQHLHPGQLEAHVQRVEVGQFEPDIEVDTVQRHLACAQEW